MGVRWPSEEKVVPAAIAPDHGHPMISKGEISYGRLSVRDLG